tara:strand:- start:791 stop:1210 length:420 start_codon:yes stop_codon:yes gene_type:complete
MQVLKPTTDEQTFFLIPRVYNTGLTFSLRDDTTNKRVPYTPTVVRQNDYLKITDVFNLVEGHFYDIIIDENFDVWNTNNDLYNLSPDTWNSTTKKDVFTIIDRIFCTAQPIVQLNQENYNLNKGQYKKDDSFNNDYIVF